MIHTVKKKVVQQCINIVESIHESNTYWYIYSIYKKMTILLFRKKLLLTPPFTLICSSLPISSDWRSSASSLTAHLQSDVSAQTKVGTC